jgi:pSer/pThr/pTyr-binding forkhead associated (FHA) protein
MTDYLEVWTGGRQELVSLEGDRATAGRAETNDVVLTDERVSRVHAAFERVAGEWLVRDLGSRNGTFVDGDRVLASRPVRPGQEVRIGETAIFLRREGVTETREATVADKAPPVLTPREREVLLALCRPAFSGSPFTEPASVKDVAKELYVTDAAIKQHLDNLYRKFGLYDEGESKRVRLANEAIRRGAVSIAELRGGRERGT